MWGIQRVTPVQQDTPAEPRSRSERNVAVLGSKGPRQVLTFLNGLRGSILLYRLLPAEKARGVVNSPRRNGKKAAMASIWTRYRALAILYSGFIVVYLPCLFSQAPSGAAFCRIQPEAERYACSDRLKTSVLGEVLSSLVLLRFYPSAMSLS